LALNDPEWRVSLEMLRTATAKAKLALALAMAMALQEILSESPRPFLEIELAEVIGELRKGLRPTRGRPSVGSGRSV
jgi:hypothetical protein